MTPTTRTPPASGPKPEPEQPGLPVDPGRVAVITGWNDNHPEPESDSTLRFQSTGRPDEFCQCLHLFLRKVTSGALSRWAPAT